MATSLNADLAGSEPRDIFDRLDACGKLLTARELASILSISEKTVYSYVARNMIPHFKIQANLRFRARDVAEWLRRQASVTEHSGFLPSRRVATRPH